jgi:long-chain fatty acid transport protein
MKKSTDIQLGGSFVFSNNIFQKQSPSEYKAKSDNPASTPFYIYGAMRLSDKMVAGLGVTTPYGNSLKWGNNWDGKYLIQDISFKAILFQPTLSYQLFDKLSIGAGLVYATGNVKLHKALPIEDNSGDGQVSMEGSANNFGFNAGIYFKASDKVSLGLDYRSCIRMKVKDGDVTFKTPSALDSYFPDTEFSAELPLPANLVLGIGIKPNDKLLIAADLQYVFWSAYKSLDFDFKQNTDKLADSKNIRNFENTFIYRIGVEYAVNKKITTRLGFAYDSTPIPEDYLTPETPGANKLNYTAGLSYTISDKISFDVSLQYIQALERNDGYKSLDFYGTYNANAIIPGFGINYSF